MDDDGNGVAAELDVELYEISAPHALVKGCHRIFRRQGTVATVCGDKTGATKKV